MTFVAGMVQIGLLPSPHFFPLPALMEYTILFWSGSGFGHILHNIVPDCPKQHETEVSMTREPTVLPGSCASFQEKIGRMAMMLETRSKEWK